MEKINKNVEISEALRELNLNEETLKQQQTSIDSIDVAKKAQEAFKEFQLKQKIEHGQQAAVEPNIVKPKVETITPTIPGIEEALKKFEEKSIIEQQQKKPIENQKNSENTKMIRLVMKLSGGLIEERSTAEYVLLGFALLFFALSIFLFFRGSITTKNTQQPPAVLLQQMKQTQTNSNEH